MARSLGESLAEAYPRGDVAPGRGVVAVRGRARVAGEHLQPHRAAEGPCAGPLSVGRMATPLLLVRRRWSPG